MRTLHRSLLSALAASLSLSSTVVGAPKPMANPDFTKGEKIPEGATHDWTLGATGARGWMYCDKLVTTDARQIYITQVAKGSPADGVLNVGDVILGVAGKPFSYEPRSEFGKALTIAESTAGAGKLPLICWRDGKQQEIVVKLPVLGDYSATAPFDCPKSKRILELGCEALAKRISEPGYPRTQSPITRSLNALALLASGNPKYLPIVKKEAQWAADFSDDSFKTWYYGYVIMLLAEYEMAPGDDSVMPGLRRLSMEAAKGQSIVGSWGHKFAGPDGRLGGYGMMNAPGLPLTTSLVMARAAGVKGPEIDLAIERSAKLLRFYIGKGSIPYGDHAPWIENHDDNGKNSMAAVLFNLLDDPKGAEFFSRMALACYGAERDTGHTGNFWNVTWAMPGVVQSGPQATGAWMKEYGEWYYDLARNWDGSFIHQGPPEPQGDSTDKWDATGAYLLAYAMPLKKIFLTGKRLSKVHQLSAAEAKQIILDGAGWNSKDRYSAYDKLPADILFEKLGSWSPVVRERCAIALSRRKDVPIPPLLTLLESPSLDSRLGACQALAMLKGKAAPAVPLLRKTLQDEDLWLRIKAADALAAIGEPAKAAIPELLELLAQVDKEHDPRGMQQRYFSFALFDAREGMLSHSLDGVDRELLYRAVKAGLRNEDGRARGSIGSVYRNLSAEEIKPLLPAILHAVVEPAPSGIMFADEIRMEGLGILASHHVEEGIQACAAYLQKQNPWASEKRTPQILKILLTYGAHAKSVIPELERTAAVFAAGENDFPKNLSLQKAANIREAILTIRASNELPPLIRID